MKDVRHAWMPLKVAWSWSNSAERKGREKRSSTLPSLFAIPGRRGCKWRVMSRWGCFDAGDLFLSGCIIPSKSAGLKACEGAPFKTTRGRRGGWFDPRLLPATCRRVLQQNTEPRNSSRNSNFGVSKRLKTVYLHSAWIRKLHKKRLSTDSQQAQLVTEGIVCHLQLLIVLWLLVKPYHIWGNGSWMSPVIPVLQLPQRSRPSFPICFLFPYF